MEFYDGIFGKNRNIVECKFYESSSLNLEETLKQILSAKKFVHANEAYLVTNKHIKERDEIYNTLRITVYDKTVLNKLNKVRNVHEGLEQHILRTRIPTKIKATYRYL